MKTSEKLYAQAQKMRDRAFVVECDEHLQRIVPQLRNVADKLHAMEASKHRLGGLSMLADKLKKLESACRDIEYFIRPRDELE